ncbi:MAG TPA: TlpA disulfide reductase family protein [bacterium]
MKSIINNIVLLAFSAGIMAAQAQETLGFKDLRWAYDLTPGTKLVYSIEDRTTLSNTENGRVGTMTVWTIRQNDARDLHVVISGVMLPYRLRPENERDDYPPEFSYAFCDLSPNGTYRAHWALEHTYFQDLFIPMPASSEQAVAGWGSGELQFAEKEHYRAQSETVSDSTVTLSVVRESPLDRIHGISNASLVVFRVKDAGMVPTSKKLIKDRTGGIHTETAITLDSVVQFDLAAMRDFFSEADIYFAADSAYDNFVSNAEEDPAHAVEWLADAESILVKARSDIIQPELKSIVAQWTDGFVSDSQYINDMIRKRSEIIGKSAPAWNAVDFKGKKHSLNKYKGKVVVLDFWYKNCPWCIRSMPALKRVAERFKDKPFAIIGMNVDKNEDDALLVMDTLQLNYVNVKAGEINKLYGVTGYPTLFIIDKKGRFYDMRIGYTPDLYETLVISVEAALAK